MRAESQKQAITRLRVELRMRGNSTYRTEQIGLAVAEANFSRRRALSEMSVQRDEAREQAEQLQLAVDELRLALRQARGAMRALETRASEAEADASALRRANRREAARSSAATTATATDGGASPSQPPPPPPPVASEATAAASAHHLPVDLRSVAVRTLFRSSDPDGRGLVPHALFTDVLLSVATGAPGGAGVRLADIGFHPEEVAEVAHSLSDGPPSHHVCYADLPLAFPSFVDQLLLCMCRRVLTTADAAAAAAAAADAADAAEAAGGAARGELRKSRSRSHTRSTRATTASSSSSGASRKKPTRSVSSYLPHRPQQQPQQPPPPPPPPPPSHSSSPPARRLSPRYAPSQSLRSTASSHGTATGSAAADSRRGRGLSPPRGGGGGGGGVTLNSATRDAPPEQQLDTAYQPRQQPRAVERGIPPPPRAAFTAASRRRWARDMELYLLERERQLAVRERRAAKGRRGIRRRAAQLEGKLRRVEGRLKEGAAQPPPSSSASSGSGGGKKGKGGKGGGRPQQPLRRAPARRRGGGGAAAKRQRATEAAQQASPTLAPSPPSEDGSAKRQRRRGTRKGRSPRKQPTAGGRSLATAEGEQGTATASSPAAEAEGAQDTVGDNQELPTAADDDVGDDDVGDDGISEDDDGEDGNLSGGGSSEEETPPAAAPICIPSPPPGCRASGGVMISGHRLLLRLEGCAGATAAAAPTARLTALHVQSGAACELPSSLGVHLRSALRSWAHHRLSQPPASANGHGSSSGNNSSRERVDAAALQACAANLALDPDSAGQQWRLVRVAVPTRRQSTAPPVPPSTLAAGATAEATANDAAVVAADGPQPLTCRASMGVRLSDGCLVLLRACGSAGDGPLSPPRVSLSALHISTGAATASGTPPPSDEVTLLLQQWASEQIDGSEASSGEGEGREEEEEEGASGCDTLRQCAQLLSLHLPSAGTGPCCLLPRQAKRPPTQQPSAPAQQAQPPLPAALASATGWRVSEVLRLDGRFLLLTVSGSMQGRAFAVTGHSVAEGRRCKLHTLPAALRQECVAVSRHALQWQRQAVEQQGQQLQQQPPSVLYTPASRRLVEVGDGEVRSSLLRVCCATLGVRPQRNGSLLLVDTATQSDTATAGGQFPASAGAVPLLWRVRFGARLGSHRALVTVWGEGPGGGGGSEPSSTAVSVHALLPGASLPCVLRSPALPAAVRLQAGDVTMFARSLAALEQGTASAAEDTTAAAAAGGGTRLDITEPELVAGVKDACVATLAVQMTGGGACELVVVSR